MCRPGISSPLFTEGLMSFAHLPEEQAQRAEQLFESLKSCAERDLSAISELLRVSGTPDPPLLMIEYGVRGTRPPAMSKAPTSSRFIGGRASSRTWSIRTSTMIRTLPYCGQSG